MPADLTRLRLLGAVARHGSLTGAADELLYTTSAVSQQVRKLEAEVGATLLVRHPRGVYFTDAGQVVLRRIAVIERELSALDHDLRDIVTADTGTVRWGVFPTIASSLMPEVIRAFRARHPRVELRLRSAKLAQLRELLSGREIDTALLWDYPWNRIEDPELSTTPLMSDETVLLAPQTFRGTDSSGVDIGELSTIEWITRADGHPIDDVLRRQALEAGFDPRIAYTAHDWQEVQAIVAAGLGVALAPRLAMTQLRVGVQVLPLATPGPPRRIQIVRQRRHPASPADDAFELELRRATDTRR